MKRFHRSSGEAQELIDALTVDRGLASSNLDFSLPELSVLDSLLPLRKVGMEFNRLVALQRVADAIQESSTQSRDATLSPEDAEQFKCLLEVLQRNCEEEETVEPSTFRRFVGFTGQGLRWSVHLKKL